MLVTLSQLQADQQQYVGQRFSFPDKTKEAFISTFSEFFKPILAPLYEGEFIFDIIEYHNDDEILMNENFIIDKAELIHSVDFLDL